jgi:hypothetical protein
MVLLLFQNSDQSDDVMDINVVQIAICVEFGQMHRDDIPTDVYIISGERVVGVVHCNREETG